MLDDTARSFLDTLKPQAVAPGAELFHGSPRDPVWDYVLDDEAAAWSFAATSEPLVLVGHSHIALEISDGENLRGRAGGRRDDGRARSAEAAAQPGLRRAAAQRRRPGRMAGG